MQGESASTGPAKRASVADDDDVPVLGDFFVCREYVTKQYYVANTVIAADALASAATDFDLTGQVVWTVSLLTSWYLASVKAEVAAAGAVCELGAGAGLCGLLATQYAPLVALTDNEPEVITLLERNLAHVAPTCPAPLVAELDWGNVTHENALAAAAASAAAASPISVPSLWRGRRWPMLVGADIVFWYAAVAPLVAAVKAMLAPDGVFILGYTDRVGRIRTALLEGLEGIGLERELVPWEACLTEAAIEGSPDPVAALKELETLRGATEGKSLWRFKWSPAAAAAIRAAEGEA